MENSGVYDLINFEANLSLPRKGSIIRKGNVMRFYKVALALIPILAAAPASADLYARLGQLEDCGTYYEAEFSFNKDGPSFYFSGGEGGLVELNNPAAIRGLNSTLFDAVITEEGMYEPMGRMQMTFSTLYYQGVVVEVLISSSEFGTFIYQPCP